MGGRGYIYIYAVVELQSLSLELKIFKFRCDSISTRVYTHKNPHLLNRKISIIFNCSITTVLLTGDDEN